MLIPDSLVAPAEMEIHQPWAACHKDFPASLIPDSLVAQAEADIHQSWEACHKDSPASLILDSQVGPETLRLVTGRTDYWDHKVHLRLAAGDSQAARGSLGS